MCTLQPGSHSAALAVHSTWTALPVEVQGAVVALVAAPDVTPVSLRRSWNSWAPRWCFLSAGPWGPLKGKPWTLREAWCLRGRQADHVGTASCPLLCWSDREVDCLLPASVQLVGQEVRNGRPVHMGGRGTMWLCPPVCRQSLQCRMAGVGGASGRRLRAVCQGWEVRFVPFAPSRSSLPRARVRAMGWAPGFGKLSPAFLLRQPLFRPLCGRGVRASWAGKVDGTVGTRSQAVLALDPCGRVQWTLKKLLQNELDSF